MGRNIHAVLDDAYGQVRQDLCASLQRVTMADVAADYHRRLQERPAAPQA